MSFESFPQESFQDNRDAEVGTLSKLKNLFFSSISTTTTTNSNSNLSTNSTTNASSNQSETSTSAIDIATPLPSFRNQSNSIAQPSTYNGPKRTRTLRLSISSPSTRVDLVHSKADLVQSGSSRSIYNGNEYSSGGGGGGGGGSGTSIHGSPNLNDSGFALTSLNLSSIPGFPLGREGGDDAKSVRSMSSSKPVVSAAHIFRRLRGEGLSKDYWIKDESSKECFDCQTIFTAFRRKHHCRICGQIFCSRCASNIISSARFGHLGVVRVCNLCLSIMEDEDPIPEESLGSRPTPSIRIGPGLRSMISAPLEASARPPQSQFAASHLFPRSETPYGAIEDYTYNNNNSGGGNGDGRSRASSRADTPIDYFEEEIVSVPKRLGDGEPLVFENGIAVPNSSTAVAPFRRGLAEDDKPPDNSEGDGLGISGEEERIQGEDLLVESNNQVIPEVLEPSSESSISDKSHPISPPLIALEIKAPTLPTITTQQSISARLSPVYPPTFELSPPLGSELGTSPPLQQHIRVRSNSTLSYRPAGGIIYPYLPEDQGDYQQDLALSRPYLNVPEPPPLDNPGISASAMEYIKFMLRQNLERVGVSNRLAWEKEILRLLLLVSELPAPNVRIGDNMNIHTYVRVKKIPGGQPRDSEYVSGVVFTKNVLHKQMARNLSNPRVMLFSFPLEYQRVENQLMSLDPLLKQEREYLQHLVARIVAQRPHVVLVERNVSRLALEYLMAANVAVARNVKPEVIKAVARATQADIISSMDRLALEPKLGRCGIFQVQTFVHSMIPGRRKTFMRFEDCNPELGCTILLRGGTLEVLTKVKKIVDLMVSVIYSAKLEGYLIRDEGFTLSPNIITSPFPSATESSNSEFLLRDLQISDRDRISKDIAQALRPYLTTAFSTSLLVKYPPPYPLARMSEEDRRLTALRSLREYEETEQIIYEEEISRKEASAIPESIISSAAGSIMTMRSRTGSFSEKYEYTQEDALKILQTPQELARISEFAEVESRHSDQLVLWDAYIAQSHDSFDPSDHQHLYVLETTACSQTQALCLPPVIRDIKFYGENDVTIGQYIEQVCRDSTKNCCNSSCNRRMIVHYQTWVHGQRRINIIPEVWLVDLERPELEGEIVMYSCCTVCLVRSGQTAMSDETYRLSLGKYLELALYSTDLVRTDGKCDHGYEKWAKYWMYRGIVFNITIETIDIRNIIPPALELKIKPEKQLQLRNAEYVTVLERSTAFWDSIDHRIAAFNYELVQADRVEDSRSAMEELSQKCKIDRRMILKLLETTYETAQATNGTEMTSVRRTLQNKAVEWETEFALFEQKLIPSKEETRRMTAVQLKKLLIDGPQPLSPDRIPSSGPLTPAIESDEKAELVSPQDPTLPVTLDNVIGLESVASSLPYTAPSTPPITPSTRTLSAVPSNLPLVEITSTDNESDSTARGHSTSALDAPTFPPLTWNARRRIMEDTSEGESELEPTPVRRLKTSPIVAELVKRYSAAIDSPTDRKSISLTSNTLSSGRPPIRRLDSGRPKSVKTQDVFSDGDGPSSYARNVGASHLYHPFVDKPSRIPARKTTVNSNPFAEIFDDPITPRRLHGSTRTSPVNSRSVSRSGRHTPSISAHRIAAEGSAVTLKARPSQETRTTAKLVRKGKGKVASNDRDSELSDSKTKGRKHFGINRPTASSSSKASSSRRIISSGINSSHRVSVIANHFNQRERDAANREKIGRLTMARGKRARPVATANPTVEVFDNVTDAVKEDSDEYSSDGADDEYDDDGEVEADDDKLVIEPLIGHLVGEARGSTTSTISTAETYVYEAVQPTTSISDALLVPASTAPSDSAISEPTLVDAADALLAKMKEDEASASSNSAMPTPSDSLSVPRVSEGDSSSNERGGSIIKTLSKMFTYKGGEFTSLEFPLLASEHIFADNPILVREDEPSSILAFTLSSAAYREKLKEQDSGPVRVVERSEAFMPDEVHPADRSTTWGLLDIQGDANAVEETLKKPEAKHFRLQFEEGTTKFFCKIFFAEQFDALRRNCGCDSQFIESLARCVKWESSGGRSKVDFLKTRDDRFIIKEISRLEMDALLVFAPAYFDYMSKAFFHGLPTILAKIFGFYRIGLRNPTTGKVMRLDILVTENLFYERQLTQVFDLKGSIRNRHVEITKDRPNEVLMDGNLIEMSVKNPLYIREGSKKSIQAAIFNDSLFLSRLNVMDYSLVVGVDSVKGELVVGIVDFIRTYTWDKKLESWVKELGGSRPGGPTIVTPEQYKSRFRRAIDSYFLLSPDVWMSNTHTLDVKKGAGDEFAA